MKLVGFTPTTKRVVAYVMAPDGGDLKVAKGLVDKILDTGTDDGGDCWRCVNHDAVSAAVKKVDVELSRKGYKTIGVAVGRPAAGEARGGTGAAYDMKFVGILPMLDPPRADTQAVVAQLGAAGIGVKMVTGDHQNIAAETCRMIGLGADIRTAAEWRALPEGGRQRDDLIDAASGFAQVLPTDKQEIVSSLQRRGMVVGMTGDGVNDAPALAQAQIGIAVEGATDAARQASDIILTQSGLSPILTAVVESRRIYQRLKAYVLYRLAATVQIVLVLSTLIFVYDDQISALYVSDCLCCCCCCCCC